MLTPVFGGLKMAQKILLQRCINLKNLLPVLIKTQTLIEIENRLDLFDNYDTWEHIGECFLLLSCHCIMDT